MPITCEIYETRVQQFFKFATTHFFGRYNMCENGSQFTAQVGFNEIYFLKL